MRFNFNSITNFKLGTIKAVASGSPLTKEGQVLLFPLLCAGVSSSAYAPAGYTRYSNSITPTLPQLLLHLSL